MKVEISYIHAGDFVVAGSFSKAEVRSLGHVVIDGYELDLRGAVERQTLERQTSSGSGSAILTAGEYGEGYTLVIENVLPQGSVLPAIQEYTYTSDDLPAYPLWPDGEFQSPQPVTGSHPNSIETATYATKQGIAIEAINAWRRQLRTWMRQASERAFGYEGLIEKVGAWLRAGDAALQREFQDEDVDPLIVAKMAREAAKGALDVVDVEQFIQSVYFAEDPPQHAILWVSRNLDTGEVSRTNLQDIVDYGEESLPDKYNSLDKQWIKGNQDGKIDLTALDAIVGTQLSAALTDPDGGIKNIKWQWQRHYSMGPMANDWGDIAGATQLNYIPKLADVGQTLRVIATYTDNYAEGNTAISDETNVVRT